MSTLVTDENRDVNRYVNGAAKATGRIAAALVAALLLASCAGTSSLYRWGEYQNLIYNGYKNPGSSDPVTDADILSADMERTESQGRQVPPGARIHLGYLYFSQGRVDEAHALFEMERQVFPESAVFVDRLISRLGAQ